VIMGDYGGRKKGVFNIVQAFIRALRSLFR
jgi:hypothetical protein